MSFPPHPTSGGASFTALAQCSMGPCAQVAPSVTREVARGTESLASYKVQVLDQPAAMPCESWRRTAAHILSVMLGLGLLCTGAPPLMLAGSVVLMLWMCWARSHPQPGVLPPATRSALCSASD